MFALLAVFYPLEFPHQFHQAVALNVYAQTFCQSQKPPAEAHLEAVEVATKAFNHHRQRHVFPLSGLQQGLSESPAEREQRWSDFAQAVCPEKFSRRKTQLF